MASSSVRRTVSCASSRRSRAARSCSSCWRPLLRRRARSFSTRSRTRCASATISRPCSRARLPLGLGVETGLRAGLLGLGPDAVGLLLGVGADAGRLLVGLGRADRQQAVGLVPDAGRVVLGLVDLGGRGLVRLLEPAGSLALGIGPQRWRPPRRPRPAPARRTRRPPCAHRGRLLGAPFAGLVDLPADAGGVLVGVGAGGRGLLLGLLAAAGPRPPRPWPGSRWRPCLADAMTCAVSSPSAAAISSSLSCGGSASRRSSSSTCEAERGLLLEHVLDAGRRPGAGRPGPRPGRSPGTPCRRTAPRAARDRAPTGPSCPTSTRCYDRRSRSGREGRRRHPPQLHTSPRRQSGARRAAGSSTPSTVSPDAVEHVVDRVAHPVDDPADRVGDRWDGRDRRRGRHGRDRRQRRVVGPPSPIPPSPTPVRPRRSRRRPPPRPTVPPGAGRVRRPSSPSIDRVARTGRPRSSKSRSSASIASAERVEHGLRRRRRGRGRPAPRSAPASRKRKAARQRSAYEPPLGEAR